jgi:Phytoene/squalene synthetase
VFGLEHKDFKVFLDAMAMDLTVTGYADYDDLLSYMEGSAAVIGTMMLPILQAGDLAVAREPARQLGLAFQLTNFIRDVAEDLDRGRVYLPAADLARFGVARADLAVASLAGRASPAIRQLIEYEVRRAWSHYSQAAQGIPMLAPTSQACIRAAYHLYSGILRQVEAAGYDVFAGRATVPVWQRLGVAARCVLTWPGDPGPGWTVRWTPCGTSVCCSPVSRSRCRWSRGRGSTAGPSGWRSRCCRCWRCSPRGT